MEPEGRLELELYERVIYAVSRIIRCYGYKEVE